MHDRYFTIAEKSGFEVGILSSSLRKIGHRNQNAKFNPIEFLFLLGFLFSLFAGLG